ncbi:1,2-alpha-L-fucosidase [Wolffia australiana]
MKSAGRVAKTMDAMERDEWVIVRRPSEAEMMASSGGEDEFGGSMDERSPLKVVFAAPANYWTDATPIGNGSLGAMIWGSVPVEIIQINHDTLWTGEPGDYTNPGAPAVLSKVRQLVDNGKYAEATAAAFGLSGHPSDVYQLLGDIQLEFDQSHGLHSSYQRELDLDTAVVKVRYNIGDVEYTREYFSSNPHKALVTKISASKVGSLSFTISMDSKLHHHSMVNGGSQIILEGSCPGKRVELKVNHSKDSTGIKFSALLDVQISDDSGLVKVEDGGKLRVENSNWAVLLFVVTTSFAGPFSAPSRTFKDLTTDSINSMTSVKQNTFEELLGSHLNDYQELYHRVSLRLSKTSNSLRATLHDASKSTADRVTSFKSDEDPSFVELLFQYGRYLLISSSRPGTQPANLQGIWSKDLEPPWDAAPHLNINLQMNYWPSLSCNLSECQAPLFDYISSLAVNGAKTAKVNYDCSGWVAHQVSDLWAKTSPDSGNPVWAMWPMGGAWLCTHLWEHYAYTMDKGFLQAKAYPLLQSCASFLLDWWIQGRGGFLQSNPSTSPEHTFIAPDGKTASVSYSSTMDIAITMELFSAFLSASLVLGRTEDDTVQRVKKAIPALPPIRIARDGSIMEWALDFQDPEVHHRHVSHLFGLYPGHSISLEKNPVCCRAVENSLFKRGDEGPGWSTAWKMALWANLQNSAHAYKMIFQLVNLVDPEQESRYEGGLYSNLFAAHPPFQIDGNFGFTAAIAEMLVQSTQTELRLLPALPRDKWPYGSARGLKARGGVTVNVAWKEGRLREARLLSTAETRRRILRHGGAAVAVELTRGHVFTFDGRLRLLGSFPLTTSFSSRDSAVVF